MAGFKRKHLSYEGKMLLDYFADALSADRPFIMKLALAKGLSSQRNIDIIKQSDGNRWEIPDFFNVDEYNMYSHIFINQARRVLSSEEINNVILNQIEKGLRILEQIQQEKNSLDDLRLAILTMN
ncbi:hypothetical protein MKY98_26290 [Paenibacillus sp. FSL M8-0228]|jgi:hypothetical protein|uniref:hypothetical protein n=1 Tax=Paenibacillus TaxID=44249 RepID=UPI00083E0350|nr:hypothetical protein [Paenibacillus polymyxa]MBO3284813.1 hypothetical protein [Paenibacillus polymyxa]MDY7990285.1 hypothetical protein [Paenibacillus polymyxa]MDY8117175.1 hypothetical protein [Paenibacillus polymyxa]ODB53767.1 hypothetical protein A7311_05360 [Paenibacillus polymyxa]